MIFRKSDNTAPQEDTPLHRIRNLVAEIPSFEIVIIDLSVDENTLVVMTTDTRMNAMIRMMLEKHWLGDVEVFNATEMMIGGAQSGESDNGPLQIHRHGPNIIN